MIDTSALIESARSYDVNIARRYELRELLDALAERLEKLASDVAHERLAQLEKQRLEVLAYARQRQAYGGSGTVGSLRVASDLLKILDEPWDEAK